MRAPLLSLCAVLAAGAPSVYWHAAPVAPSQATLFAGSFGESPSVRLCSGPSGCTSWTPVELLDGWNESVKFAMPSCDGGPCRFQICSDSCIDVADPNAPDVWFAMAHPPLLGTTFSPVFSGPAAVLINGAAATRSVLRVVGRALAFQDGQCVFAGARQANPSTVLLLSNDSTPIEALNATCFEATFDLTEAVQGGQTSFPDAVLQTPFGSYPFGIAVAPPSTPAPLTVIDVDSQANGNISAALAQAAALPGYKLVTLSGRSYSLTAPIIVPNNTVLAGKGAGVSAVVFTLPDSGTAPSAALSGAGDSWGITDFSLILVNAPAKTPAVHMPPNTANFTAIRVNVTMLQVRLQRAPSRAAHNHPINRFCPITTADQRLKRFLY